jgi:hypothetical protein
MVARKTAIDRRRHAKKRLSQRYGLEINRDTLDYLEGEIRAGRGTVLEVQSRKRRVVLIEGLLAVYKSGQIVTFLPEEWYERRVGRDMDGLVGRVMGGGNIPK